jgi:hypothetical protein
MCFGPHVRFAAAFDFDSEKCLGMLRSSKSVPTLHLYCPDVRYEKAARSEGKIDHSTPRSIANLVADILSAKPLHLLRMSLDRGPPVRPCASILRPGPPTPQHHWQ